MDIRCSICGEPWDVDCLHDETASRHPDLPWISDITGEYEQKTYEVFLNKVKEDFGRNGCDALKSAYGGGHNTETIDKKNSVFGVLMEFAGDDIDFASELMEDAERYGLID